MLGMGRNSALLASVAALVLPATAHAATATLDTTTDVLTVTAAPTGSTIFVTAIVGDQIQVAVGSDTFPASVTGCTVTSGQHTLQCPDAEISTIVANGNDSSNFLVMGVGGGNTEIANGNGGIDDLFADSSEPDAAAAPDTLNGGEGNDNLAFGKGVDVVTGGGGTDTVTVKLALNDTLQHPVNVSLDGIANDGVKGGPAGNIGADIETVETGNNDDTIVGGTKAETLRGVAGNDNVTGGGGADNIDGGAGDDAIVIAGGGQAAGGADADTIDASTAPDDQTVVTGGSGNDILRGADGDQRLDGGTGSDTITGGAGKDYLIAGDAAPADLAPATLAADGLDGGAGDDFLYAGYGADDVKGGTGFDTVVAGLADPTRATAPFSPKLTISLDDAANDGPQAPAGQQIANWHADVESVVMTTDNDDTIVGSATANVIQGGPGSDTIAGGGGVDTIWGGLEPILTTPPFGVGDADGGDTIDSRDAGIDTVNCGAGADTVIGDDGDALDQCETADLAPLPGTTIKEVPVPVEVKVLVPSPPPVAPPVDRTPPVLTQGAAALRTFKGWSKRALAKSKGTTYPVSTNETATVTCAVLAKPKTTALKSAVGELVIAEGKLASGTGLRSCPVRLAAKYRKQVARLKRLRIKVIAVDAAGNRSESIATVRLIK